MATDYARLNRIETRRLQARKRYTNAFQSYVTDAGIGERVAAFAWYHMWCAAWTHAQLGSSSV